MATPSTTATAPTAERINWDDLFTLAQFRTPPCVTIYLGTQLGLSGEKTAAARLHHLIQTARGLLSTTPEEQVKALLDPAETVAKRLDKSGPSAPGHVFLSGPGLARQFTLPTSCDDEVHVENVLRLGPLVTLVAENAPFWILALSRKRARLLRADARQAEDLALPKLALGIEQLLMTETQETVRQAVSVGRRNGDRGTAVYHGQGGAAEHAKSELREYLTLIDHEVCRVLASSSEPLVVASVSDEAAMYRDVTKYRQVLPTAVTGNPDDLSDDDLRQRAWPLVRQAIDEQRAEALRRAPGFASATDFRNALPELWDAARAGRIETLYVARGARIWSRTDMAGDKLTLVDAGTAGAKDLVEEMSREVLAHRGRVLAIEPSLLAAGVSLSVARRN